MVDKKELFDRFEHFSDNLVETLSNIESLKKQVDELLEENTRYRLEISQLREHLQRIEAKPVTKKTVKQANEHLFAIYKDGFHVCSHFYGQRREDNEDCMFCMQIFDRE
ncbi:MAG: DNA replication initiation control protein YabA [Streptococcus sp.]|nr:DNA replication initiation control protein YabA [Streptococcus sp.]